MNAQRAPRGALLVLGLLLAAPRPAPAAGARLFKSGPLQVTADGAYLWAANLDHDSVTRIRTADDAVLEVPLPDPGQKHRPRGLSVLEDGSEAWIACHDSDRVYVLAGADGAVLARIDLPWGGGPCSIAISPDQRRAVVTLHRAAAAAVLDVPGRRLERLLEPLFWSPMGIAWTLDGGSAWVTHLFANGEHPFLTRIDFSGPQPEVATSMQVFATDPRQSSRLAAPYNVAEGGYLTMRGHPAEIPPASGRHEVWLPMQYNNISEDVYTPDSTVQSSLRRLQLATRRILNANSDKVILSALHVHDPGGGNTYRGPGWDARVSGPVDIGFSADGGTAYVLHELSNDLVVLPANTPAVKPAGAEPLPEIATGSRPTGLAVSPVAEVAYVYNLLSRDVSVIDLAGLTELRRIPVTPVTGEPLPPAVLRGARLFHTSADRRISANDKVACASCHINAEIDGRGWGFHHLPGASGPREVPSLLGLALTLGPRDPATGFGQLHRSGDRDEVQDFEHTFRSVLMGGSGFLGAAVQPELGAPNAGRDADLDAIADYLLSLDPLPRSPHREADGSLSEAAVRGATFFAGAARAQKPADAGCAACHVPETGFVDFKFHNVGQKVPASEEELDGRSPANHVNTATLVGVWATPHYTGVAGFAESILDVLEDQAARAGSATPHGRPDGLTGRQLLDLAEFVLSIDGHTTAAEVRGARDTLPPRVIRAEATSLSRIDVWFNETVEAAGAEDPASWRLEELGGAAVPVAAAVRDGRKGDRVTLTATLRANTSYRLRAAGAIHDAAATASGGTANPLDPADPRNTRELHIGQTLTVTLGASSAHHIRVPVHDAAMLGPSLSTWSHDSIWLFPANGGPGFNTGFLRFDWRQAFIEATGVASAGQIVEVRFTLRGSFGEAQSIHLRRVLQPWSDPASGGDWNQNPAGGPTWRDHSHPGSAWNQAGAAALGGSGGSAADYGGAFDLAATIDATVSMPAVNGDVVFGGPLVTEAFRFWFDNPAVDHGYALRLAPGSGQEVRFERWESELMDHGPVLTITYDLSGVVPVTRQTIFHEGDAWRFLRGTQAPPAGWTEPGFDDSAWEEGPAGIGYGDGDDRTVLADMRCTTTGGGEGECVEGGYLAFFARKEFQLAGAAAITGGTLSVSYDDGFVAHVNGVEVGRVNVAPGAVTHETPASATVEDAPLEPDAVLALGGPDDPAPAALLLEGRNVVAFSVHNVSRASSDVSFIPALEVVRRGEPGPVEELFRRGDADASGSMNITDALRVLNFLFGGGPAPPCRDAADADDDGALFITDGILILNVLFLGVGTIASPGFESCGPDPTGADPFPACAYDACP